MTTTAGAATAPTLDGLHLLGAAADSWEVVETEQVGTIRMANGAVREQRLALAPSAPVRVVLPSPGGRGGRWERGRG